MNVRTLRLGLLVLVPVVASTVPLSNLFGQQQTASIPVPFAENVEPLIQASLQFSPSKDADVDILFSRQSISFDADGRRTRKLYKVVRYLTRYAVNEMGVIGESYSPWREKKPRIRARVISPDGSVHDLNPATMTDTVAQSESARIFSDARVVQAPLPALEPGCLLEYTVDAEESQSFCSAGVVETIPVYSTSRTLRREVIVEYPTNMRLRLEDFLMPPRQTQQFGGLTRVTWSVQNPPALDFTKLEGFTPFEVRQVPLIRVSTGGNWLEVARAYESLLPKQDSPRVRQIVGGLVGNETDRDVVVEKCLKYLREKVRYTGLEFGAQAIIPRKPDTTLVARYGDCKDQSSLLVAMLAAAGHKAHLALVHTSGMDNRQHHPGLDSFNHAIVYVPGDNPLWLDPTQPFQRANQPPAELAGELALVIGANGLQRIPHGGVKANRSEFNYVVTPTAEGITSVLRATRYFGSRESHVRRFYANATQKEAEQHWDNVAQQAYGAKLAKLELTDPHDFSKPFSITTRIDDVKWGHFKGSFGALMLTPLDDLIYRLPDFFYEKELKPRKYDLQLRDLHEIVLNYRVTSPEGYVPHLARLPRTVNRSFGDLKIEAKYSVQQDEIHVAYRLDTGKGRMSAKDVTSFHKFLLARAVENESWGDVLAFSRRVKNPVKNFLTKYRPFPQLTHLHNSVQQNPDDVLVRARYANLLAETGFTEIARQEIEKALSRGGSLYATDKRSLHALAMRVYGSRFPLAFYPNGEDMARSKQHLESAQKVPVTLEPSAVLDVNDLAFWPLFDSDGFMTEDANRLRNFLSTAPTQSTLMQMKFLPLLQLKTGQLQQLTTTQARIDKPTFYFAAVALTRGSNEAVQAVRTSLYADSAREVVLPATDHLMEIRRYDLALNMLLRFPEIAQKEKALVERLRTLTQVKFFNKQPSNTALEAVKQFVFTALLQDLDSANRLMLHKDSRITASSLLRFLDLEHKLPSVLRNRSFVADQIAALPFRIVQRADDLVDVFVSAADKELSVDYRMALVRTADGWQILNGGDSFTIAGEAIEWYLQQGKIDRARAIGQEVKNEVVEFSDEQPFRQWAKSVAMATTNEQQLRVASVLLQHGDPSCVSEKSLAVVKNTIATTTNEETKLLLQQAWLNCVEPPSPEATALAAELFQKHPKSKGVAYSFLKTRPADQLKEAIGQVKGNHPKYVHAEFEEKIAADQGNFRAASRAISTADMQYSSDDFAWNTLAVSTQPENIWTKMLGDVDYQKELLPRSGLSNHCAHAWRYFRQGNALNGQVALTEAIRLGIDRQAINAPRYLCLAAQAELYQMPTVAEFYYQLATNDDRAIPAMRALAKDGLRRVTRHKTATNQ